MNLFCTADEINKNTGGGLVCHHEAEALKKLGECESWDRSTLIGGSDPWGWDQVALGKINKQYKLAHFYSGSFSNTVKRLKDNGCKITYTCAAHRVSDSKKAFEDLGFQYNFPHLTDKEQWKKYSSGYWNADVLIVPSKHSKHVVEEQCDELKFLPPKIEIIPHGCEIPKEPIKPLPKMFTVGVLGAINGPDKGLRYLLSAWKKLNYKDAILFVAGKYSTDPFVCSMCSQFGGGNIYLAGWQNNVSDFYNKISLLVQPSCTEGFGLEVLEAHAHGRLAICSDHAGAVDLVHESCVIPACNSDVLAERIDEAKKNWDLLARGDILKQEARSYTWEKIKKKYIKVWKNLLGIG